jgi:CobQ-like glutamine amidotransferase family enzyme
LPKNPVLTDWLLGAALERRGLQLPPIELDDQFEREAKISAMDRAVKTR